MNKHHACPICGCTLSLNQAAIVRHIASVDMTSLHKDDVARSLTPLGIARALGMNKKYVYLDLEQLSLAGLVESKRRVSYKESRRTSSAAVHTLTREGWKIADRLKEGAR